MILQENSSLKKIISITIIPIIGILLYFFYTKLDISFVCIFHEITGLYCPGCGITRSFVAIVNGEYYQAFRFNPYGCLVLPFLIFYIQYEFYCWGFNKKDCIIRKIPKSILYVLIVSVLIYGVLRNVEIFDYLAPTNIK